jgi:hypothetical protein
MIIKRCRPDSEKENVGQSTMINTSQRVHGSEIYSYTSRQKRSLRLFCLAPVRENVTISTTSITTACVQSNLKSMEALLYLQYNTFTLNK